MSPIHSLEQGDYDLTLIFGPQTLGLDEQYAKELRSKLTRDPSLQWIVNTLLQLPQHWATISRSAPMLEKFDGKSHLDVLSRWVRTGDLPNLSIPLCNTILTPLVVANHLTQYSSLMDILQPSTTSNSSSSLPFRHHAQTLGLCTGMLSAAAVSCAKTRLQLEEHGATALRLAMALGAFIDAKNGEESGHGPWASMTVGWNSSEGRLDLDQVLQIFPEAYISVLSEEKRATITSPEATFTTLTQQLKKANLAVAAIPLHGAFHNSKNATEAQRYLNILESNPLFRLPHSSQLHFPTRSNRGTGYLTNVELHREIACSMLSEQSNWIEAFSVLGGSEDSRSLCLCFGQERCAPQWLRKKLGSRFSQIFDPNLENTQGLPQLASLIPKIEIEESIAVVGMACRVPGAIDVEAFWDILCEAKSQHQEVPAERFQFETPWRKNDSGKKWYGNFISEHDAFDHKFFGKTAREASSTDPQQRLMLEVAYQAVEQSGYFNLNPTEDQIGCYIGVGLGDYENNVACHAATAYTATGNLKAFVAGKISHYFGWTGPGLTIDTACSSSAVAIHQACRAIISGECTAALAGGVNVMTSPEWFQNLAGASFLSPTGQCKPFDVNADGYCRGEGVGAVFLKKLSAARRDGNHVLGVIAASAVYQNENCASITVPSARSLSGLFQDVTRRAGLIPAQISVVEAHGTGTQVGDPAEYNGVRNAFCGGARNGSLSLGSVKGLIGHTESASGIVALIKVLLMINKGAIPPQASFHSLNPAVNPTSLDNIEISKSLRPWEDELRAALINNYGASGSNASLLITQPSPMHRDVGASFSLSESPQAFKLPIWLSGRDDQSLQRYCSKLLAYLQSHNGRFNLDSLSYHLYQQSNHALPRSLIFSCSDVIELKHKLGTFSDIQVGLPSIQIRPVERPAILCFGGQVSTSIGLDKNIYNQVKIFRDHLDYCNSTILALGYSSIFPEIFNKTPSNDIVKLQIMLFASQYASAKSWIDCGVKVASVVGHSFGEITALCISGVLSVRDTLKLIARRARIIEEHWPRERGLMLAVETNEKVVQHLLAEVNSQFQREPATVIACINGPQSFTLAGPAKSIEVLQSLTNSGGPFESVKTKQLKVTHAFHSALVDSLLPHLDSIDQDLVFREPVIPLEKANKENSSSSFGPGYASTHLRNPVYFHHAVERLASKFTNAIWLEAGSNSTIVNMASRALGLVQDPRFLSVNLSTTLGAHSITEVAMSLWKQGLRVSFWTHHSSQSSSYDTVILPPYQFENSKHWLDLVRPQGTLVKVASEAEGSSPRKGLWTLIRREEGKARFLVNTTGDKYLEYVSAHVIAQTAPICPSTLQLAIAVGALNELVATPKGKDLQPELLGMESHVPMTIDDAKVFYLDFESSVGDANAWAWKIFGSNAKSNQAATVYVSGRLALQSQDDTVFQKRFAQFERQVSQKRCSELLDGNASNGAILGNHNIYRAFSGTVQYQHTLYRGLQKLAGTSEESAGRIIAEHQGETMLDFGLADNFCQVAGIFLNCMTDLPDSEMFISDRIDQIITAPGIWQNCKPKTWEVLARHHRLSTKEYISDVFVFDADTEKLMEVVLGIHYARIPRARLALMLGKMSPESQTPAAHVVPQENKITAAISSNRAVNIQQTQESPHIQTGKDVKSERNDVSVRVRDLLCDILGLETTDIQSSSDLVDLGIDSLMAMELTREIENLFSISIDSSDLMDLTDFQSLVTLVQAVVGPTTDTSIATDSTENPTGHPINGTNGVISSKTTIGAQHPVFMPKLSNGDHGHSTLINGTSRNNSTTNGINGVDGPNGHHDENESVSSLVGLNGHSAPANEGLPASTIIEVFSKTKAATDQFIRDYKLSGYSNDVLPLSNKMCVVMIADAFEQLGCSLRGSRSGDVLPRIKYLPKHEQLVEFLYSFLADMGVIHIDREECTRTNLPLPAASAEDMLRELVQRYPDHSYDHQLTFLTGCKLVDCLTGKIEGIQLLFADPKGKEVVSGMYAKSPINVAWLKQIEYFLEQLFSCLPKEGRTINILEMGAGTGGTTSKLVPLLASIGVPIQYTVTDLSSSLVAGARKRFKNYPFMQFKVLDIEKAPSEALLHSQDLVLATNCVHATHNLAQSTSNIHQLLRPDGVLLMLEMTETIPWIDLVFGLVEGWWLFDDGRKHALAPAERWADTLRASGYGHVDWTDGLLPEAGIQRVIVALASSQSRLPVPLQPSPISIQSTDIALRQEAIDAFVNQYAEGFALPTQRPQIMEPTSPPGGYVVVTGATGSLGSHLVAYFASQPSISNVICLNRHSSIDATLRQHQALESRGLSLSAKDLAKLTMLETDTSKSFLGLSDILYAEISQNVTHIVHNAWPMSLTRPIKAFEAQFKTMRNLIDLARTAASHRSPGAPKITFQFVSSIATAGFHPLLTHNPLVPEQQFDAASVLPSGYGDAKLVCEHLLEATLRKDPASFRAMAVRIGQITGSKTSGYWNPVEHLAFVIKSSQTIKALPDLKGHLSWCPVNDVSATLGELALAENEPHAMYHIENPVRQPWVDMISVLSSTLGIPQSGVVAFDEWLRRVRDAQVRVAAKDNPAAMLADFLEAHFIRMSCGDLVLDTTHAKEHSKSFRNIKAVGRELVVKYVNTWREEGFLK